jgi:hypothetical protein
MNCVIGRKEKDIRYIESGRKNEHRLSCGWTISPSGDGLDTSEDLIYNPVMKALYEATNPRSIANISIWHDFPLELQLPP